MIPDELGGIELGAVLADLVEILSQGNVLLMLILTGVLSLILGMGLPTTANYIVVSSLMAGVVVGITIVAGTPRRLPASATPWA